MNPFWLVMVRSAANSDPLHLGNVGAVFNHEQDAVKEAKKAVRSGNPEVFILESTMSFKAALDIDVVVQVPDNPTPEEKP